MIDPRYPNGAMSKRGEENMELRRLRDLYVRSLVNDLGLFGFMVAGHDSHGYLFRRLPPNEIGRAVVDMAMKQTGKVAIGIDLARNGRLEIFDRNLFSRHRRKHEDGGSNDQA